MKIVPVCFINFTTCWSRAKVDSPSGKSCLPQGTQGLTGLGLAGKSLSHGAGFMWQSVPMSRNGLSSSSTNKSFHCSHRKVQTEARLSWAEFVPLPGDSLRQPRNLPRSVCSTGSFDKSGLRSRQVMRQELTNRTSAPFASRVGCCTYTRWFQNRGRRNSRSADRTADD